MKANGPQAATVTSSLLEVDKSLESGPAAQQHWGAGRHFGRHRWLFPRWSRSLGHVLTDLICWLLLVLAILLMSS